LVSHPTAPARTHRYAWILLALVSLVRCSSERPGSDASATGGTSAEPADQGGGSTTSEMTQGGSTSEGGSQPSNAGTNGGTVAGTGQGPQLPERVTRYIRSDTARQLRIEIDAVSGLAPFASSQTYIRELAAGILDKPDGVTMELDETLPASGADTEWTFDALAELARSHASEETAGTITVQVLALDGHYTTEDGGSVLGLAWSHRFIALFQQDLRTNCTGLLGGFDQEACEIAERNVWAHEVGHVIGLVDNGVPMVTDHRDPDHGAHDVSEGCLMYWAYDRPEVFDTVLARLASGGEKDLDLCAESRADLDAVR
jgi:hypothetical protein